jgi:suppressor of fused
MSDSPGWDAIDGALKAVYGPAEPLHWGTAIKWALGGPDPLDGISAYAADGHWHYVSYGFSELYEKTSEDTSTSGYGFELTFRLARPKKAGPAPVWPSSFLQNLARYVFSSGNIFAPGHHVNLNGPIALGEKTAIVAALFAADPELPEIDTPNGRVAFVQIVGATLDEFDATRRWDTKGMLEVLAEGNPKLVTDLRRTSRLADAETAKRVAASIERDGSSQGSTYVTQLEWNATPQAAVLTVGALVVEDVVEMLKGRLGHDRDYALQGPGLEVLLRPAAKDRWGSKKQNGFVQLSAKAVEAFRKALKAKRGDYSVPSFPGFTIRVVPTEIKDQAGKVLQVVG